MVMVGGVMGVAVHRPDHILLQPVGMAMLCDHLGMFLQDLDEVRNMGRGRGSGPDQQRDT